MPATVIIPARYDSTRFPGKLLARETGRTLLQHVYERAVRAERVDEVLIATDDDRIDDAARGFGARVVRTRADHPNGTSRIAEACESIAADVIVNVQGDEPEVDPAAIDAVVDALDTHPECPVSTAAAPFASGEDPTNPNVVKVVVDRQGHGLYFSRSLIPFPRDGVSLNPPLKHLGLYGYRREFLSAYAALEPTPLEQTEKLEQLRVLEHGHAIAVAITTAHFHGVDTPEQYEAFVQRWAQREG